MMPHQSDFAEHNDARCCAEARLSFEITAVFLQCNCVDCQSDGLERISGLVDRYIHCKKVIASINR